MSDCDKKNPDPKQGWVRRFLDTIAGNRLFDDRIDIDTELTTSQALLVINRALGLLKDVPTLFLSKLTLQVGLVFVGLVVPWLVKIITDNIVLQEPLGSTEVRYPPFLNPLLNVLEGMDPMGMMLVLSIVFVGLLLLFGSRMSGLSSGLFEGRDVATTAENQASAGYSEGSGVWGLLEFMAHVRLSQSIVNNLRRRLYRRLSQLPTPVLDNQRAGDSLFRVLYDVPMTPNLVYDLTLTPTTIGLGAILNLMVLEYSYSAVSPELILIAWFSVPLAFIISFPFSGALRRTSQNKRAAGSATTNALEESIRNTVAVQSLGASEEATQNFKLRSFQSFLRERFSILVVIAAATVAAAVFGVVALYVGFYLIPNRIIEGSMSIGDYAVLLGSFSSISDAAGYFGAFWIKLQDSIAGVRRVLFFLDAATEQDNQGTVALTDIHDSIELRDVSFAYADEEILKNLNLKFSRGELTVVVGSTGAGKTSLAYLLPRLQKPTSGVILADGKSYDEFSVESIRQQVTYVFQEHSMLSMSIRENLLLVNPSASESELDRVLELAQCNEFIRSFPDGLETHVGRNGETLSLGQQQRLSIARGLLRNTPVMILDEPTSALDPNTESKLLEGVREELKDKIVIVISHRPSATKFADRVLRLDGGVIREMDSDVLAGSQ